VSATYYDDFEFTFEDSHGFEEKNSEYRIQDSEGGIRAVQYQKALLSAAGHIGWRILV